MGVLAFCSFLLGTRWDLLEEVAALILSTVRDLAVAEALGPLGSGSREGLLADPYQLSATKMAHCASPSR